MYLSVWACCQEPMSFCPAVTKNMYRFSYFPIWYLSKGIHADNDDDDENDDDNDNNINNENGDEGHDLYIIGAVSHKSHYFCHGGWHWSNFEYDEPGSVQVYIWPPTNSISAVDCHFIKNSLHIFQLKYWMKTAACNIVLLNIITK